MDDKNLPERGAPWWRRWTRTSGAPVPSIESLIEEVRLRHPHTPASSDVAIRRFETRTALVLPDDMRAFYRAFDGARLWDAAYVLVDPDAFLPLGVAVRAAIGVDPSIPDHWTWFARTRDGEENLGIRLGSPDPSEAEVAVWVPGRGRLRVVARGYSRFLHAALYAARRPYWR